MSPVFAPRDDDREPMTCCGSTDRDPNTEVRVHAPDCKEGGLLYIERARRLLHRGDA